MNRNKKTWSAEQAALAMLINQPAPAEQTKRSCSKTVYEHVLNNSNSIEKADFTTVAPADLGLLFHVTDELVFDGLVGKVCEQVAARPLSFRLSTRMTSTGGMTTMQRNARSSDSRFEYEIAIATTPLFESFKDTETASVGGVTCKDRLQALQRIMEHEMVHLIELLLTGDSNCSAAPFKRIVGNFFGHTQSKHQLLTPGDTARKRLGITPGDRVCFDNAGRTLDGFLQRVTKRATVLVPDNEGTPYDDGCRYSKYYVPLKQLRRA